MEENDVQAFYTFLQSQETAQAHLYRSYEKLNVRDAKAKSYENVSTFMYYLDHGNKFYENGKNLDTLLQPILYFYGMVHLLKACLIARRPNYPESTSILAHGVSTRKRKKQQYTFMDDEVKLQHNGLFPYFSEHLFSIKGFPFEKVKMRDLFAMIPELALLFKLQDQEKMIKVGTAGSHQLDFPTFLLDSYHLTAKSFIQRVQAHSPKITHTDIGESMIRIELAKPLETSHGPFFVHTEKKAIYFPIKRDHFFHISEVMVHYLLLYNLSMLCRYEAEWWGELLAVKPEMDYPFISHFLTTTAKKIPLLLGEELYRTYDDTLSPQNFIDK